MLIVVVRHGQAEPKKGWTGPDDDRPLVPRGHRQADLLDKVIDGDPPSRIVSSPALRCVQTVQPLADRHGVAVEVDAGLATDAGRDAVDLCYRLATVDGPDDNIVLCTHREVLVDLLPRLSKDFGRELGHRPPGAKGGAWLLRFEGEQLLKVDYRPPGA